jgi:uroporphyrinogen-III synthase
MCALLREAGAEPIPHPTVVRTGVDDVEGWKRFQKLVNYGGMCLFQSEAEVTCFVDGLLAHGLDMRSLGRFKIAAQGESTESALLAQGIRADWLLQCLEPQALASCISGLIPDASLPLIWVRGSFAKSRLEAGLQERCPGMISLTVCLDSTAEWDIHWKDELIENPPDYIAFTGATEVEGFVELLGEGPACSLASRSCVGSINAATTAMLRKRGLPVTVESPRSGIDALVCTLASHSQERAIATG